MCVFSTDCEKYFTKSKYTHIAMILKDPSFTNPPLKGLYIIESGEELSVFGDNVKL